MKHNQAIALLLILCCSACSKLDQLDDLKVPGEIDLAVPLIQSTISIEELLDETNDLGTIYVDESGLIHFLYEGQVLRKTARDFFNEANFLIPPIVPVSRTRVALPLLIPDNFDIDSLVLKSAKMAFRFENPHQEPVDLTVRFPEMKLNGQELRFEARAPAYSGSGSFPVVGNTDAPQSLAGYSVTPINDTVYVEYTAVGVNSQDTLALTNGALEVDSFDFFYVEGFFGNEVDDSPRDTIELEFFDAWTQGDVYFADPTVTLDFENSFGLPTQSVVNVFDVISVRGEILSLESPFVENGINFPYPSADQVGEVVREVFVFDKTNSNLDEILGSEPILVDYDIDAVTNPDSDPNLRGFLTDSSYYRAQIEVDLPLFGTGSGYLVYDTLDLDLSALEDVVEAEFKVVADNGIPMQMEVTFTFINEAGEVVATLLEDGELVVEGAPVDAEGNPTGIASKTTFIPVSEAEFDQIVLANRGILTAVFSTSNGGNTPVRITQDQSSNVRMGAIVKVATEE